LCAIAFYGRSLIAGGSGGGEVRLWDPRTGEQQAVLEGHQGSVRTLCAITVDGRALLASSSDDTTVRLWDPRTGLHSVLEGHQGWVSALCPVTVGGRALLASGSQDGTVRLWDPRTSTSMLTMPTHYYALGAAWVAGSLAVGLETGILVIKLAPVA
jgi:WD40 repeat protein